MVQYAEHFSTRATPQSEQADPRQVANNAGGFVFQLDPWKQLDRWLILGGEGGTYYASERAVTRDNAKTIEACLAMDGARTVEVIARVSETGRAPKNEPAIFALALAAGHADPVTRKAALAALPRVCRIGTHLFQFVQAVRSFRGWGPGLQKAVARWYAEKTDGELCHQLTKYQQRGGVSHRDVLRLAHPKVNSAIYRWAIGAETGERTIKSKGLADRAYAAVAELPAYLQAFEELRTADERRAIALIAEHGFTHEMVPTERKRSAAVWEALLYKMPMGAMVRNLGVMSSVGLLAPMSAAARTVAGRLGEASRIKKARLHPVGLLSALRVYQQGHGEKGKLSWNAVPQIVDALDGAFYLSFEAIEPTGKRTLLALDVSGSMESGTIAGVPGITPRIASAALAMVTARTEKNWHVMAFSGGFVPISISPRQRLDDVIGVMQRMPFDRTDCALPMLWAASKGIPVDVFHVYTDNETWAGRVHPHQALRTYREMLAIQSKVCVVGMTATGFTIADPTDPGMLDVVGMDTATPNVLADFARQ